MENDNKENLGPEDKKRVLKSKDKENIK